MHDLPDFVYFNHSIHVNKGVGCTTCHGQVDRMPLMWQEKSLQMEWCLDCHRNPERYVRPREAVFRVDYEPPANQLELGQRLVAEYQIQKLTSCSTCGLSAYRRDLFRCPRDYLLPRRLPVDDPVEFCSASNRRAANR